MQVFHTAPDPSTYIPLSEHQSRTPASFYSGPPVLHHRSDRCKILVLDRELFRVEALTHAFGGDIAITPGSEVVNGSGTPTGDNDATIVGIDVWVTSEKLLFYSHSKKSGVAIPYPSISLHAIQTLPAPAAPSQETPSSDETAQGQGLYMQVVISPENDEEDELDTISLTIIPSATPQEPSPSDVDYHLPAPTSASLSETQKLFEALSACSNLHPDPGVEGDEEDGEGLRQSLAFQAGLIQPGMSDGGLPPAMAEGGWITAENMHEFVDEEGNWIGGDGERGEVDGDGDGESLGPGAGTVRARDANGGDDGVHGEGEGEETKWRRTG